MSNRLLLIAPLLALTLAAQTASKKPIPRTADGHPDFQGVWTNATLTPMERPASFAGKLNLTEAEAKAFENHAQEELTSGDGKSDSDFHRRAGSGETGGYNALFIDRGSELARVDGVKRSSLVIDPRDGRVPPLTPEARQRLQSMRRGASLASAKDRPLSERCLWVSVRRPARPCCRCFTTTIIRSCRRRRHVMILVEMDPRCAHHAHECGRTRRRMSAQWLGDSIGHWEGDTLVVDTTNFNTETRFCGSSENLHVIERFRRVDANTILYKATIDDPTTFPKTWTMEYPFVATTGPVYEYACHEGNYAMTDILGGARKEEAASEKK